MAGLDIECIEHTEGASVKFYVFNESPTGPEPLDSIDIGLEFQQIGLTGNYLVRDLWAKKDLGVYADSIALNVRNHGARLVKISRVE